jgi:signal transduction histidine kinase
MATYLALPGFPGEQDLHGELTDARAAFDRSVAHALAAPGEEGWILPERSLAELLQTTQRLDLALQRIQEFNAAQGQRLGLHIAAVRHSAIVRTLLIDFAVGFLAMSATVVAAIAWRRSLEAVQNRSSELDMFAGRVAHDVLSPLMAVSVGLELSRARFGSDSDAVKTVDRATRALQRVRSLVESLLEFARAGASPAGGETADVSDTIAGVLECLDGTAKAARIELGFDGAPRSRVTCAPGVLMSLVQNLVHNAIKYMGDSPKRHVRVRVRDAGRFVRVEVEDTGPGVPGAIQARIFEPFVRGTSAAPGAGLGLATAKKLAEAHGGRVGCQSAPGAGSRFWFELPRAPALLADAPVRDSGGSGQAPAPST